MINIENERNTIMDKKPIWEEHHRFNGVVNFFVPPENHKIRCKKV